MKTKPKRFTFRMLYGPDIQTPFTVLAGMAVIRSPGTAFGLPPGCTWPGASLPDDLQSHLRPATVELFPETVLDTEVALTDLQVGIVIIRALSLQIGPTFMRFRLLPPGIGRACNQATVAGAIGVARESISPLIRGQGPR